MMHLLLFSIIIFSLLLVPCVRIDDDDDNNNNNNTSTSTQPWLNLQITKIVRVSNFSLNSSNVKANEYAQ